MSRAYVALGSNIGPKRSFIDQAVREIGKRDGISLKRCSSMYDTYPAGCKDGGRFLNGVVEIETSLMPDILLAKLLGIERSLGRVRTGRNLPRTIDLDILLYDDLVVRKKNLVIPHPRMHERDFVIFGMNEIAPEVKHPVLKKSIGEIYNRRPMVIIRSPKEAYKKIDSLKKKGKRIGLVPTMGYLHEGHLSLIRKARRENDVVVVSIFINPTQFSPGEDFKIYPRDIRRDNGLAKKEGVDIIFFPDAKEMYKSGHSTFVEVGGVSANLCGGFRPGHFKGVATIVTKLFNIVPADNAYFGRKDAQQAFVIKRMARDLNIPVDVKMLPTIREKDGLAMSSRNSYLDPKQRREAAVLYRSLMLARDLIKKGEEKPGNLIRKMRKKIESESSGKVQYISIVDTEDLKDAKALKGLLLIALAVYFGRTKLIDNLTVNIG